MEDLLTAVVQTAMDVEMDTTVLEEFAAGTLLTTVSYPTAIKVS